MGENAFKVTLIRRTDPWQLRRKRQRKRARRKRQRRRSGKQDGQAQEKSIKPAGAKESKEVSQGSEGTKESEAQQEVGEAKGKKGRDPEACGKAGAEAATADTDSELHVYVLDLERFASGMVRAAPRPPLPSLSI